MKNLKKEKTTNISWLILVSSYETKKSFKIPKFRFKKKNKKIKSSNSVPRRKNR